MPDRDRFWNKKNTYIPLHALADKPWKVGWHTHEHQFSSSGSIRQISPPPPLPRPMYRYIHTSNPDHVWTRMSTTISHYSPRWQSSLKRNSDVHLKTTCWTATIIKMTRTERNDYSLAMIWRTKTRDIWTLWISFPVVIWQRQILAKTITKSRLAQHVLPFPPVQSRLASFHQCFGEDHAAQAFTQATVFTTPTQGFGFHPSTGERQTAGPYTSLSRTMIPLHCVGWLNIMRYTLVDEWRFPSPGGVGQISASWCSPIKYRQIINSHACRYVWQQCIDNEAVALIQLYWWLRGCSYSLRQPSRSESLGFSLAKAKCPTTNYCHERNRIYIFTCTDLRRKNHAIFTNMICHYFRASSDQGRCAYI